jgi:hypothetical protein
VKNLVAGDWRFLEAVVKRSSEDGVGRYLEAGWRLSEEAALLVET